MNTLTPEQILDLLHAGDRDEELIGCFETPTVDFKGTYHLEKESEKWELAKDVAAFANSGGGLIVIGVETKQDEDRAEDVVSNIKPVPKAMFVPKTILDLLKVWVYPRLEVEVLRHPRGDKCLGTILVQQRARDLPYLVTRIPDNQDKFQQNTGIAWPERGGTHTSWKPVGQIHATLQQRNPPPTATAADPAREPAPAMPIAGLRANTVDEIDSFMSWNERAFIYLIAHPETPDGDLPNFFGPEPVLDAVRNPHQLRWAGFGITYGDADTDLDGRIISTDEDRFLRVSPNGILEAAACAGSTFLTRGGGHEETPGPAILNPVVVTEWTYLYCHFLHTHLMNRAPGVWNLTIGVHEAIARPWSLTALPGRWTDPHVTPWIRDGKPAGKNDWHDTIRPSNDPGKDAYRLLALLYSLFGQQYDEVGFSSDGKVDPELIVTLNQ